jgi:hypothetical protein
MYCQIFTSTVVVEAAVGSLEILEGPCEELLLLP